MFRVHIWMGKLDVHDDVNYEYHIKDQTSNPGQEARNKYSRWCLCIFSITSCRNDAAL